MSRTATIATHKAGMLYAKALLAFQAGDVERSRALEGRAAELERIADRIRRQA